MATVVEALDSLYQHEQSRKAVYEATLLGMIDISRLQTADKVLQILYNLVRRASS